MFPCDGCLVSTQRMFINPVLAAARAELVRRRGVLCSAALAAVASLDTCARRARGTSAGRATEVRWMPQGV